LYTYIRIICVWCFHVFWPSLFIQAKVNCPTNPSPQARMNINFHWLTGFGGGKGLDGPSCQISSKSHQSIAGYHDFSVFFQDSYCRHAGFLNFSNFIGWRGPESQDVLLCWISLKSVKRLLRYRNFSNGGWCHLDFRNSQMLLPGGFWRAKMHHRAKFRQNLSIHCGVILIFFYFWRWRPLPSWFQKFPNFVKIGHGFWHTTIFYFSRWWPPPFWISEILKFY